MNTTVKILLDAVVKNKAESLHILERVNSNGDDEGYSLNGLTNLPCECTNLSIQEITTMNEDGVIEELYKPSKITYDFVKVKRKKIMLHDVVVIDGIDYAVTPLNGEMAMLYSYRFKKYFSEDGEKQSIEEINKKLENIKYDIYKCI